MSTLAQFDTDRDFVNECVQHHYQKARKSRHRHQLHVDQFANVTMVECVVNGKLYRDWFLDGAPVFSYWLGREDRIAIVKEFFEAGYTQSRIALMLGFSGSTIGKDVQYLRENGDLPADGHFREKPVLVRNRFKAVPTSGLDGKVKPSVSHQNQLSNTLRTMRTIASS